jgi:hypothetical protein
MNNRRVIGKKKKKTHKFTPTIKFDSFRYFYLFRNKKYYEHFLWIEHKCELRGLRGLIVARGRETNSVRTQS